MGRRIRPPMTCRYGMVSSHTAMKVMISRMMTAPAVPIRMAFLRRAGDSLLAAMAMTTALSPPRRMSSRMIVPKAVKNCIDNSSIIISLLLSVNKTKETSAWYQSSWYHAKVSPIARAMLPPAGQ